MITGLLILTSIVVSAWPLAARESTDVIVMNNDDRLTRKSSGSKWECVMSTSTM